LSISMRRHHLVLDHFGPMGRSTVAFLLIIVIVAPVEVSGTFVFAWATVLSSVSTPCENSPRFPPIS
jgi:hypothetical protein